MSKNCIHCVAKQRTGLDLLCDDCRRIANDSRSPVPNEPQWITEAWERAMAHCHGELSPDMNYGEDVSSLVKMWRQEVLKADKARRIFPQI